MMGFGVARAGGRFDSRSTVEDIWETIENTKMFGF
jgi:hypothetical protein